MSETILDYTKPDRWSARYCGIRGTLFFQHQVIDLQQVPRIKTCLANSLNHPGSGHVQVKQISQLFTIIVHYLIKALMPSADDKSSFQDRWSHHAMFRGGVGGLIVLRSSSRQEIRHHFCSLHNAPNSSIKRASSQSRSGESIPRISIHARIHISIFSNKNRQPHINQIAVVSLRAGQI